MFENCTIRTKTDILKKFGTRQQAIDIANKYRFDDCQLSLRQLDYMPEKLRPEWQAFWSNVAFYEQNQCDMFKAATND